MDRITNEQIIHCLNLYLDLKQNNNQLFNDSNVDSIVLSIQNKW